jgi:hypothetical protein
MQLDTVASVSAQQLTEKGEKLLGFLIGDPAKPAPRRTLTNQAAFSEHPGWVFRGGRLEDWHFQHYVRRAEVTFVTGPSVDGMPLHEVIAGGPASLGGLRHLASALESIAAAGHRLPAIALNCVMCLPDGTLIFPPTMVKPLTESRSAVAALEAEARIGHPDLAGAELLSHTLAVLVYRALAGRYPFTAAVELDLRAQIRNLRVAPLSLAAPGTAREIVDIVGRALRPAAGTKRPSLREWAGLLTGIVPGEVLRPVADQELTLLARQLEEHQNAATKRLRRTVYLQTNGPRLTRIGAAVVVLGVVLGSLMSTWLAPRATHGFASAEVVAAFYAGMGELDHATMEDARIGKAGEPRIREVINVFLQSRVALATEGRETVVGAQEWIDAGQPELPVEVSIYGAGNLELVEERGPPEPTFVARYEMYSPGGALTAVASNGRVIRERVYLRKAGQDWVIFQFEPLPAGDQ